MFANAKENEQRSKERNLQLIDKLDKMEKKLTHVDMTRLRDARVDDKRRTDSTQLIN